MENGCLCKCLEHRTKMGRCENVTLTNMCMIRRGDQVLVQQRTDPVWPGICFPGGHVEKNEPVALSVIREVREETGLTIKKPRLCGIKEFYLEKGGGRYLVFLFLADAFTGELRSSSEGEVFWIPRSELESQNLAEDFACMLKVFEQNEISECCWFEADSDWVYI